MAIDAARATASGGRAPARAGKTPTGGMFVLPWQRRTARVPARDVIYFTAQLSLMMEIGTSLTDAMRALEMQTENPALREAIRSLATDMEEGQPLSAALARHPRIFDGVFVSMVRAGETGGYLRDALERVVEMREKREALLAQVRASLAYPIILAVISLCVIIFIIIGVLPKFLPFFAGKEEMLPLSTRMLMQTSTSLRVYWWAYLVGVLAAGSGIRWFAATTRGRWLRDKMMLSLPVVGPLTCKILTGQMLRTLGHLLESHVALTDALAVTRLTLPNQFYRQLVDRIQETVVGGGRLAHAFRGFTQMPASVRQMIATGEAAGNLYPVMLRLARHYDTEIERDLKRGASFIEPVALVILGAIVGVIVASVILPMFKMAHAIG